MWLDAPCVIPAHLALRSFNKPWHNLHCNCTQIFIRQYCALPRVDGGVCVPWPPVGCRIHVQCLVWRHWIWVFWREQTCSSFSLCPRWVESHYTCKDRQIPLKTTLPSWPLPQATGGEQSGLTNDKQNTHTRYLSVSCVENTQPNALLRKTRQNI